MNIYKKIDKTGVLLINLGTPDDLSISSIRKYLKEFLLDPRVIDIPAFFRYLLVYGIIAPFRPRKTMKAYEAIWCDGDSPLRIYSKSLTDKLQKALGEGYIVSLGMRYGYPSIKNSLERLKQCSNIIILPLFPQYSSAATGSAIQKALEEIISSWNIPALTVIDQFHDNEYFITACSRIIKPYIEDTKSFLLFSYHGIPERHIKKSKCNAKCDLKSPCPELSNDNYFCYRAQCYNTSKLIAKELALNSSRYSTSFQSRLGRTPWIKPYTDIFLEDLYKKGVTKLVVCCPSFVSDCLETIEEIGIQAKNQWQALGGENFQLIPCLNDNQIWINALKKMIINN